jgi:DMSO/TMAO reductase YedYZ molybdopterin-dependent catalytic subunit
LQGKNPRALVKAFLKISPRPVLRPFSVRFFREKHEKHKKMKKEMSRRDFFRGVKGVGLGTIGLGFGVTMLDGIYQYAEALTDQEKHSMLTKGTVNFKGFMAKEITPNEEFYITSYSAKVPALSADSFRLKIEGPVERPYTLSMKDIAEMKDKTEFVTLECIGNSLGGDAIGNALWEGVTLRKIIEKAAPMEGIVKTVFHAEDGYTAE